MTTWLRRLRPLLFALGVVLVAGTLVGSRFLSPGTGGGEAADTAKSRVPDSTTPAKGGSGPVVIGYVDSDPQVVKYGLPPNMQTGLVGEVFVKEGDEVKAGTKLFAFDSSLQAADVNKARVAILQAEAKLNSARDGVELHQQKIELNEESVGLAALKVSLAAEAYEVAIKNMKDLYQTSGFEPGTWDERLSKDQKLLELKNNKQMTAKGLEYERTTLRTLKKTPVESLIREAETAIEQAKAEERKAQAAVALCTVHAHVNGIVERLNVSPGDVLGMGSRTPALWFVPTGPRIVRAEVEPDFAHRVMLEVQALGASAKPRELTVYDNTDSKVTYKGTLKRVGTSFLPRRNASDGLMSSDTLVLECDIEVADWAPAGKPPLRVGQKVRVNFGQ